MSRTVSFFLVSFCVFFLITLHASAKDKPSLYEEIYPEIGYKSVEEAVGDFEQHFNQKLKLPLRVPSISFTHHFGRFTDSKYEGNDAFEVTFINDQSSENHYKIDIRPLKYRLPIREKYVIKTFELKNGNVGTYMTISGFNVLVFERDNLQYMLSVDKRVSNKVTPEALVDIANSIDY
ncbi:hypothetical protein B1B04_19870 [Lysinibacillus sp. KCTC 33748]|uniref:hypothetical protein n=1 Tax=unclassified Lysinibacillus TaxID=2636778 RepID=UPI0009A5D738|nr:MULTISPECIES: hypothetical protein [unclassified Lysinibacillus]OXS68727.1 hypothetical protein B1B04_19870 [Lysinibacillus sp. KCTC 33748]SKC08265.1 hypothetical protein SAMN06295926_12159 [Lysinibacillus sp. AC-3]